MKHNIHRCSHMFTSQMHLLRVTEIPQLPKKGIFHTPWVSESVCCDLDYPYFHIISVIYESKDIKYTIHGCSKLLLLGVTE